MSLFVPDSGGAASAPAVPGVEPVREPVHGAAMWQVHDTYIFAETRGGLLIVDQHAAHERILYEETLGGRGGAGIMSQRLLFPVSLPLSPAELATAQELGSLFSRTGFEIELSGTDRVVMHAAPEPHPAFDAEGCLREMIGELAHGSELVDAARNQHQRVALSFATRAAIRPGQRLSAREMAELFDRLFATGNPYRDLHGGPILVELPLAELRRRFGR